MREAVVFVVAVLVLLVAWFGVARVFGGLTARSRDDAWRRKHLHPKPIARSRDAAVPPAIPRAEVVQRR